MAILLIYAMARLLLAGEQGKMSKAKEEYIANGPVHEALNGHQGLKLQNKPS